MRDLNLALRDRVRTFVALYMKLCAVFLEHKTCSLLEFKRSLSTTQMKSPSVSAFIAIRLKLKSLLQCCLDTMLFERSDSDSHDRPAYSGSIFNVASTILGSGGCSGQKHTVSPLKKIRLVQVMMPAGDHRGKPRTPGAQSRSCH